MSFTLLPRLHFKGGFETDVCTANNDDIVAAIDQVNVKIQLGKDDVPKTDPEFIAWMRGEALDGNGIGRGVPRASWNYYGGNGCSFFDCKIVAADLGDGLRTSSDADATVGAAVILGENPDRDRAGVMVDLNPEGTWATQIFADSFQIVSGGVRLEGPPTVASSRWLHFGRNISKRGFTSAAATWQSCIRADEQLKISPGASGTLLDLYEAAQAHRGLIVRYCTYLISPSIPRNEILQKFEAGGHQPNPARGIVLGTVGVWEEGDYMSMPNGRLLLPHTPFSWDHGKMTFGPATISLDENRGKAVVDMITMVPEIDAACSKLSAGMAMLVAIPDNEGPADVLSQFPYDKETYEKGGGLVEMDLTPEQCAKARVGTLAIRFGMSGSSNIMREQVLAVDTDDRNVYLENHTEQQIKVRVRERGGIPSRPVKLKLLQYIDPSRLLKNHPCLAFGGRLEEWRATAMDR